MKRLEWILCVVTFVAFGCGPSRSGETAEADNRGISELVTQLEGVRDRRRATPLFAAGATPTTDVLKRLSLYSLSTSGQPAIAGDAATLKVKLTENRTGTEAGEIEWAFVKENGAWKIKSAPLP